MTATGVVGTETHFPRTKFEPQERPLLRSLWPDSFASTSCYYLECPSMPRDALQVKPVAKKHADARRVFVSY
jgi:hypothetical protein